MGARRNYLGGAFGFLWLAVILLPIYYVVITAFKSQSTYMGGNPFALPSPPTLENFQAVVEAGFSSYLANSVIVVLGAVLPLVLIAFMASYAITPRGGLAVLGRSATVPAGTGNPRPGDDRPRLPDDHRDGAL